MASKVRIGAGTGKSSEVALVCGATVTDIVGRSVGGRPISGWVFFICTAGFVGGSGRTVIRAVSFFGSAESAMSCPQGLQKSLSENDRFVTRELCVLKKLISNSTRVEVRCHREGSFYIAFAARSSKYPVSPLAGKVKIHAQTIRSTTIHFIPVKRFTAPTPMMEVEITWVVERGMP